MTKLGFRSQVGFGTETTYGTAVVPSRFYEFRSESISMTQERIESAALRRSDFQRGWQPGIRGADGDVEFELGTVGFGFLFQQALGGVATAQPDAAGAPTVYEHTLTPGDMTNQSMTVQVGRDDVPFTYPGCKVGSWSLSCSVGELALLTMTLVARDEVTATGMATATYPTGNQLLSFVHGSLEIAGVPLMVSEASVEVDNGLDPDRRALGSSLRRNPLRTAFRNATGSFQADFDDLTLYNRYVNGEEAALTLAFEGSEIAAGFPAGIYITANVRFDGDTPTVGGPEEIRQTMSYKAFPTGTDASALTVMVRNAEATP